MACDVALQYALQKYLKLIIKLIKMKKRLNFWGYLSLQIIAVSLMCMLWSYMTDLIKTTNFFGDTLRVAPNDSAMDQSHYWGIRHYIYQTMSVLLLILSCIRIGMWVDWYWKTDYQKKKFNEDYSIK